MTSTTSSRPAPVRRPGERVRRVARPLLVLAFWLGVWQLGASTVGHDFLLASPASTGSRLTELVVTGEFWSTVGYSLARITVGFLAAVAVGALTAAAAAAWRVVDAVLSPAMTAVRAAPVVSFILLALIWAGSSWLAAVTSFLMVLPIVHGTVLGGIRQRDRALLEMAEVFRVPLWRRFVAIDVPSVLPYFATACHVGVGLAWKAGVAAEVIGLPEGSIGERMYQGKLLLSSADVLAWTVVVIAVSFASERLVAALLARGQARLAIGRPAGGDGPAGSPRPAADDARGAAA
ncbi:ABC transporter permease [Actinotalea fermentans]|uniref:Nitrate ABC transporter permease n=1 Tax=Actinotalea fermentans TaxID=43671 RepID=A0A511Z0V9_9CELL|nr:ABC transporter permease subunit [Actinotalea fermentans]GEN81097.1 nitrate ABC transporter permease [Actinotalea fermentans]